MSTDESGPLESDDSNQLNLQNNLDDEIINNENEENETDEELIDPNDLIIINEPNEWEPSNEQINAYINNLGFDTNFEYEELRKIAYNALKSQLPNNWVRAFTKETSQILYINVETNEIELSTEIEEKAKEDYEKLKEKKTDEIFYPNEFENKENEKLEEKKNDNNKLNNEEDNKYNELQKDESENNKKIYENNNMKKNEDLENNYQKDFDKENHDKFLDNYNQRGFNKEKNDIEDEKVEKIENQDLINSSYDNDNFEKYSNIAQLKNDYLKKAKNDFEKYKENLKKKYIKEKKDFFLTYDEKFEKNLLLEKRNQKDKIQNNNKHFLEELEENLFNEKEKELEEYKTNLIKELKIKYKDNENHDDDNYSIKYLDMKKNNLLSQIKNQKNKKQNFNLQRERKLEELFEKQKNSINDKKKILDVEQQKNINQIENEYEKEFEKFKKKQENIIKNEYLKSKKNEKYFSVDIDFNNILNDYKKELEDNNEFKKMEIRNELELKKNTELNNYMLKVKQDINSQIEYIQNEQNNLGKIFNDELEKLKENGKKDLEYNMQFIYNKIEENEFNIDSFKNNILDNMDKKIQQIKNKIDNLIRYNKINSEQIIELEKNFETFLFENLTKEIIIYNNKKSMFEICEKEYKEKKLKFKYFIDLINYIIKILIEYPSIDVSNIFNDENEERILNDILYFGKENINKYRNQNLKEKNEKIFPYLDFAIQKLNTNRINFENENENSLPRNNLIESNLNRTNYYNQANQTILLSKNNLQNSYPTSSNINYPVINFPDYENIDNNINNNNNININNINNNYQINSNQSSPLLKNNISPSSKNNLYEISSQNIISLNNRIEQNEIYNTLIQNIPELPKQIVENLNENDFQLYSQISDFLYDESSHLAKEYNNSELERNSYEQLNSINERGHLLHLRKVFNNEKNRIIQNQQILKNKLNIFNLIQNHTQEIFNFICNNPMRISIIQSKFNLIIQHINDYNKTFKNINLNNNNKNLQSSKFEKNKLSIDNVSSLSVKNNINRNDYFSPKKKIDDTHLKNNFRDFYITYGPEVLDDKLNTRFSHQFFNWKKNNDIIDYKINSRININN